MPVPGHGVCCAKRPLCCTVCLERSGAESCTSCAQIAPSAAQLLLVEVWCSVSSVPVTVGFLGTLWQLLTNNI